MADAGTRLDVFVARHAGLSRSEAARRIETGEILVDGTRRKPSFTLRPGMRVHGAWAEGSRELEPAACGIELTVLFEDPWIALIDKPAGLVVHPGAGNSTHTLVNALLARYPSIRDVGDPARPGIVHRLDKLTSGVMVVALTADAHAALSAAFKAHRHTREYLAVCHGQLRGASGTIETFMERNPKDRKRMTSRTEEGRRAVTHWEVLRRWQDFSLVRLRLETGRTHQIRVHLSEQGNPLAGDPVYGGRRGARSLADPVLRQAVSGLGRQMLHACLLGITHPATGEPMVFTSPLPADMEAFIAVLDAHDRRG
ncbi:MAG TPA: RluA family pseudouridine synthase [Deltaproteobacteria bacterium]|nr:RluA family pseudouridine synthase [Deltaproteobacteria bacterium]